jgi:hypothetical protein
MMRMTDDLIYKGRNGEAMRLQADTLIQQLGLDKVVGKIDLFQGNLSTEWGNQLLKQPLTQDQKNRLLNAAIRTTTYSEKNAIDNERRSKDPSMYINLPKEQLPEMIARDAQEAKDARVELPAQYALIKSLIQAGADPAAVVEDASGMKRLLMPVSKYSKGLNEAQQTIFKSLLTMGLDLRNPEVHDAITNYGDPQMRALLSTRGATEKSVLSPINSDTPSLPSLPMTAPSPSVNGP